MAKITIAYDNRVSNQDCIPGWGFSAMIEANDKQILFDTGADKLVLEHNAKKLDIGLDSTDVLVLSHEHCDHIGAISSVLRKGLPVWIPQSFSQTFVSELHRADIEVQLVSTPELIAPGVQSIGQIGRKIPEQAILVKGDSQTALVTGCAHPGIVQMAEQAHRILGNPPQLILGGFHLGNKKAGKVREIAAALQKLGIERIGPCHCTGRKAMSILKEAFADQYLDIATGCTVEI